MNTEQIVSKLKDLLHERFAIDTSGADGDTRLGDLGIDSLHVVDVMLDIESEMGFSFDSLDLPPNPSLKELSEAIGRNLVQG
jgi:acyl carrier protein